MSRIEQIAQNKQVQKALRHIAKEADQVVRTAIEIQQIPAPTFAEEARAIYIQSQFDQLGLADVQRDSLNNVFGRIPGTKQSNVSPVILSAHADTVFPAGTDLTVRHNGRFIYGPGLGDNAVGVAGLIHLTKCLIENRISRPAPIWFVANVGEEGLGNLRGMREVVRRFGHDAAYIVVEGGLYGQISHQAIAVRRFRVEVKTLGGHSWGNFGQPNAIHELARIISEIDQLEVRAEPKTTYNVGVIEGGTTINSIAQTANMQLDVRSESVELLDELVSRIDSIILAARNRTVREFQSEVIITMTPIGFRPAGSIPRQSLLVQNAWEALRYVGCPHVMYIAGSTDANVPLSQGIEAVCIGLTDSGNAHRLDEYIDPKNLPKGLCQLLLLTLATAGL